LFFSFSSFFSFVSFSLFSSPALSPRASLLFFRREKPTHLSLLSLTVPPLTVPPLSHKAAPPHGSRAR